LLSYPQASLIPATPIAKCTGLSVYYAEHAFMLASFVRMKMDA